MITDIHSHKIKENPEEQIISLCMKDQASDLFRAINISVGIHPWFVSEFDMEQQIEWVRRMAETDSRVVAIGECGTDKACKTHVDLQITAFTSMIEISEQLQLPLIIHSVKTANEIISFKKELKPKQKWIMHGFRGKKETALQLTSHGIYISIGEKFNPETVKNIPLDMLLSETDESTKSIKQITENISIAKGIDNEKLTKRIVENTNNLFFNQ